MSIFKSLLKKRKTATTVAELEKEAHVDRANETIRRVEERLRRERLEKEAAEQEIREEQRLNEERWGSHAAPKRPKTLTQKALHGLKERALNLVTIKEIEKKPRRRIVIRDVPDNGRARTYGKGRKPKLAKGKGRNLGAGIVQERGRRHIKL